MLVFPAQRTNSAVAEAHGIAEEAIYLEDEGREREAVERWREIFGGRMPRP
jgi:hypothetical protein